MLEERLYNPEEKARLQRNRRQSKYYYSHLEQEAARKHRWYEKNKSRILKKKKDYKRRVRVVNRILRIFISGEYELDENDANIVVLYLPSYYKAEISESELRAAFIDSGLPRKVVKDMLKKNKKKTNLTNT